MSAAFDGITRVRLLALLVIGSNLLGAATIRMLTGTLRSAGGQLYGESLAITMALVGAGCIAAVVLSFVLLSCFVTYYRRRRRDPFVGAEFLPAWADVGLIVLLLVTGGVLLRVGLG